MGLGKEAQGPGEGETEVGFLACHLVTDCLSETPAPIGELELDGRQAVPQPHEIGDSAIERDFRMDLHPLLLEELGDDGAELRFPHGEGATGG